MKLRSLIYIPLLATGIFFLANTQELESNATANDVTQNKIDAFKEISKELNDIRSKTVISLDQLAIVKKEINVRKQLVTSIKDEILNLNQEIEENQEIIDALKGDIQNLKKEYAKMIYAASKQSLAYNRLLLLFSANSINQFYSRMKYMQQYTETRKNQVEKIKKVEGLLELQVKTTQEIIDKKQKLIKQKSYEANRLANLIGQKDIIVASLSEQKDILKLDLKIKQENLITLDKLILSAVEEQIDLRKNKPQNQKLSKSFQDSKGYLPWVVKGHIVRKFGKQKHSILKNIYIENNGIDIQAKKNSFVKAIHGGKVLKVIEIPKMKGKIVMMYHGDFYSIYANVRNVFVSTGDWVSQNKNLAQVYTDDKGITQLQFQIWYKDKKLNPEKWLKRKR